MKRNGSKHNESNEEDSDDSDISGNSDNKSNESKRKGKLIIDATVAEQAIKYPNDLDLLN